MSTCKQYKTSLRYSGALVLVGWFWEAWWAPNKQTSTRTKFSSQNVSSTKSDAFVSSQVPRMTVVQKKTISLSTHTVAQFGCFIFHGESEM